MGPEHPPPEPAGTADLAGALQRASQALAELQGVDVVGLQAGEVLAAVDTLERLRRQVEGLASKVLAAVEAHGLWAAGGARSLPVWYRHRTGRTDVTARTEVRRARTLREHLPATAAALAAGVIGPDHAAALARHATDTQARRDQLADPEMGEAFLLTQAQAMDATLFTRLVRRWAIMTDPEAAEASWKEDVGREELYLSRTTGGYDLRGWLTETSGDLLYRALSARTPTPAAGEKSTPAQRRAAALDGLAHLALDSGTLRPGARIRPHLAVTVPFDTLKALADAEGDTPPGQPAGDDASAGQAAGQHLGAGPGGPGAAAGPPGPGGSVGAAGAEAVLTTTLDAGRLRGVEPATLEDGTPLPHGLLARLACGSAVHRVVFGPASEILDVGREERLFTTAQTRAIIARDRHCQSPDCTAPPGEGEIHHSITWWAQHGPTDVALGVLLCWHHHDLVHARDITITRLHGQWHFHRPDGTEIHPYRLTA
ncbi:HNH endonuclease [Georgenia sp. TF02-10]|uniref:HNH endonuclease signature motif containing protein n=1 Tax=Georgenia sp. TF02-10 TaxID=2917725 RepID=UPI001FA7F5C3|nr:HNH endonuclease signature motif containing protein [Georgenia sp. TF02-10]UNX54182.1 HNH endonuclease [Georgenia sp. TF02-10]